MKPIYISSIAILLFTPQLIFAAGPEQEFIGKLNWYLWEQSRRTDLDSAEKARITQMKVRTGQLLNDLVGEKTVGGTLPEILQQEKMHQAQQIAAKLETRELMKLYQDKVNVKSLPAIGSNKALIPKVSGFSKLKSFFGLGRTVRVLGGASEAIEKGIEGYAIGYVLPTIEQKTTEKELIMRYKAANHKQVLKEREDIINGLRPPIREQDRKTPSEVEADYDAQIKQINEEIERLRVERDILLPRRSIYDAI